MTKTESLWKAAEKGDLERVKALIAGGADLNKRNRLGETALMKAAEKGNVECVNALIAAGADVNAKDKYGKTVLQMAHRGVKGHLRAAGAKTEIDFKGIGLVIGFAVAWAAFALGIAALMHRLCPQLPTWSVGIFGIVSVTAIIFCVALLLGFFEYDAYKRLLLFGWAVLAFCIAALMHLLSPWLPTWMGAILLGVLAAPIICPLVLLLPEPLPSRKQINARDCVGKTPLILAAEDGDQRRVGALLRRGADVNAHQEGYSCTTALIAAAEKGSADCAKTLIDAGADFSAKDNYGKTALERSGHISVSAILQAAEERKRKGQEQTKAQPGIRYKEVLVVEEPNLLEYNGGPEDAYYERLSISLISLHGPLVGVDFNTHPDQLFFRYKDGHSVFSGTHTSATHDISCMGFGYVGAGPRHLRHFLSAAGINLTNGQIESRKSGESMEIRDGKPVIFRPGERVVDSGGITFQQERTMPLRGSTAQATVRHCEAPNKAAAKRFLEKQNITARAYYVVVSTPEGQIGRDVMGIYEE